MLTLRFSCGMALLFGLTAAAGCGGDDAPPPPVDGGHVDAGGAIDAGGDVDGGGDVDAGDDLDAGGDIDAGDEVDAGRDVDGGGADGGTCTPTVTDTSGIGDSCSPAGTECATGYICFGFSGVVLSYSCEIACTSDCDCANPTACATVTDKAGDHRFCRAL